MHSETNRERAGETEKEQERQTDTEIQEREGVRGGAKIQHTHQLDG